ncbi:hypothetical protein B9Z55_007377 [Caenorhabditis nigoni]|uniref:Uncharacterized protein n=1 Tax=Caenorhabditis nigoni TaxID=1611254 RepID=A0A2G5V9Q8_9PELO|nr:hypothetical protein B9Z55_007377 [Caenorhabditis nigoni]
MDVINIMTAEEYAEFFPRASKEIVRIQASETSAFETTPYGKRLMAEEAEKEEEKQKEAHKVKNPLLTTRKGRFLVVRIVGQEKKVKEEDKKEEKMAEETGKDSK